MKITVFGAGMVGRAIVTDLAKFHTVTAIDKNDENLRKIPESDKIIKLEGDIFDDNFIERVSNEADLLIGAVPGFLGYTLLKKLIKFQKNIVDISFFPEDTVEINTMAQKAGVTVVYDCGVAPGLSNIILAANLLTLRVDSYACYVGGLPFKRQYPHDYKAPFSPIDVIEEYTRPARLIENGKIVIKPALSDREYIDIEPVGTLEAFNTDGLRSLLNIGGISEMKEKTLRYPGHIEKIILLRDMGFFSEQPVEVQGMKLKPIDVTASILLPQWKYESEEDEFTAMLIHIEGTKEGRRVQRQYSLFDRFNGYDGHSSMARTTGYTCTAVAELMLSGAIEIKGVLAPENIITNMANYDKIIAHLTQRGVRLSMSEKII